MKKREGSPCSRFQYLFKTPVSVQYSSICSVLQYLFSTPVSVQDASICSRLQYLFKTPVSVQDSSICSRLQYLFKTPVSVQDSSICSTLQYLFPSMYGYFYLTLREHSPHFWAPYPSTNLSAQKTVSNRLAAYVKRKISRKSLKFIINVCTMWCGDYGTGVGSASNRNEYQEYFLGVKAAGA